MPESLRPTIGIVGGNGAIGKWFATFFRTLGLPVLVSDLGTPLTNEDLVRKSDVVIFSVPIGETVSVIRSLLPFAKAEQLWMDVTSIKSPAVAEMLASSAEVLGTHPLFGPSARDLCGQNIILCPGRLKVWNGWFDRLLKENGANVTLMTPEKHDHFMAVIQGLTHFTAITLNYALQKLGFSVQDSMPFTSPIYRMHLDIGGRILAQNPRLYAEIQTLNPAVVPVLAAYQEACSELRRCVEDKNLNRFQEIFKIAADHLGSFREKALTESDELIDLLVRGNRDLLTSYNVPPTSLGECRERIDEIDRVLARLLTERMRLSTVIGEIKKVSASPVEDRDREKEVLRTYKNSMGKSLTDEDVEEFVSVLVGISKKIQRKSP